MLWHHEPPAWRRDGDTITISAVAGTDFWRKTHDGGIRDNGHFYYQPVRGDFTAEVHVRGDYRSQYDQAGLMLRQDETCWLKCGVEYVDGTEYASSVVTRDWSDWSILPVSGSGTLWLRLSRQGPTITVSYSVDGADYSMMRQAFLTEATTVNVGVMAAAPKGNGFTASFEALRIASSICK